MARVFLAAAGLVLGCLGPAAVLAATVAVEPGPEALRKALARAAPGDVLQLKAGRYRGPVRIERPLSLVGHPETVIDGGGAGTVITVAAPDVVLRGLTVKNSGASLEREDSGIFVTVAGSRALIEDNRLAGNLIGVYLKGPRDAVVRGNRIVGRKDLRVNERGNGVQLWNTPGSVVEGNEIRHGRDGIFVTTSKQNSFRDNRFGELRFAIHYMYTNDSEVSGNVSRGNHVGYAVMFSHRLTVRDNLSDGDRDHGFLFNYANRSQIVGNAVRGGAEKCVFIYNANKNSFRGNRFQGCAIGIHFTAGSERNEIAGNAFIGNRTQVKYVGTREVEWSVEGQGNYWSDNPAFDLDNDGIAERPYRPNGLVDQIVWRQPLAKLLLNSPAVQVLRWAQSEFPALHPGGVTDSAPLMAPPDGAGTTER
ncbi:MAG: nitrous oxide reductase family maturation protein NosD [Kiloniellales bacterium]|nr:nitrous oxide reductase family maturation protein NosD [Kiloniellales bacterium]